MKNSSSNRKYRLIEKITINASQDQAWEVLQDFNNVYTWAPGVEESYGLNNKNQEVGAGRHCKLDGFGEIEEYVTEWNEGTGFVYDVTPLGPLTNALSSWELNSKGSSTQLEVDLRYDIRFGLFGRMMHKFIMRKKLDGSLSQTLRSLKDRIETGKLYRPYHSETVNT